MLTVNNLHSRLLQPVSFTLAAGECVCLAGPSGIGKTLLLRSIADLDPNRGEVRLEGRLREEFLPTEWRRRVMLVPAESHWWASRVGEHIERVDEKALQQLGFTESVLGWEVARLSSGERQRLAILRALSLQPQVLLLDEPTANLDPDNGWKLEQLLRQYRDEHRAGLLWVSHSREQRQRVADRVLRLAASGLTAPEPAA